MRYSLHCGDLIFWKTIARQNCEAERRQDCADPARILERRPMGMLLRDLDAPLPLIGHVSSDDFACLNKHGFFCNELTNEDWCQEAYGTSCATLSGWAENLPEKCRQQRADWCDDPVRLYDEYRPRSIEEVQRRGTRIRHGGLAVRDRLFINLDVRGSDDSRSQDLTDLLQRFPGM
jgi:hypothetical protein